MNKVSFVFLLLYTFSTSAQEVISIDTKRISPQEVGIYDEDLLSANFHEGRRNALRELMEDNSVAVLFSAPIRNRSNDVDYEYHQDPNFYYLTGLREPHSAIVIFKEERKINGVLTNEILFVQDRDPSSEVWTGKRLGVNGALQLLGVKNVYSGKKFRKIDFLPDSLSRVYYIKDKGDIRNMIGKSDLFDLQKHFKSQIDSLDGIAKSYKLSKWLAKLRQDKQEEELVLMRKAIDITCKAQTELMKGLEPGMKEYQTEALVEFHFKYEGAEYTGFPSIHGSGENSCILHYTENRRPMANNDLLVSDIGAEYHGYTADVTRTLPLNGKYSEEQKLIYNLVLEAQDSGIAYCLEGKSFWDPHSAAMEVISNGLIELGIIEDKKDVRKYFMHGTSHYLGLDVHDPGDYSNLSAGEVITVEPGVYIAAGSPCHEKWWNIGIRIEDDILITKESPENLSDCVPRSIEEIERLMEGKY